MWRELPRVQLADTSDMISLPALSAAVPSSIVHTMPMVLAAIELR